MFVGYNGKYHSQLNKSPIYLLLSKSLISLEVKMEKRVALWGSTLVGFLSLIFAISASTDSQYVGAGLLFIASALAFGFVGFVFLKR